MTLDNPVIVRGTRYYHVAQAVRAIGKVSGSTLRRWVKNGWTSFAFPLDPINRGGELLIPELKVRVLKEHFQDFPLRSRGSSGDERDDFRRESEALSLIAPRSPYSRRRLPKSRLFASHL